MISNDFHSYFKLLEGNMAINWRYAAFKEDKCHEDTVIGYYFTALWKSMGFPIGNDLHMVDFPYLSLGFRVDDGCSSLFIPIDSVMICHDSTIFHPSASLISLGSSLSSAQFPLLPSG